jgi:hypothetical protein
MNTKSNKKSPYLIDIIDTQGCKNILNNTTMKAIEKMRAIVQWADYQSEYTNFKFKTIDDIEKIYDYCQANDLKFCDWNYLSDMGADNCNKHAKAISKILKYNIY